MSKTPRWVLRLAEEISERYGVEGPELHWHRYTEVKPSAIVKIYGGNLYEHVAWTHEPDLFDGSSFGQCDPKESRIDIFAGPDRRDQKMVMLHEMAHHIMHRRGHTRSFHSPRFWDLCYKLYVQYDVPLCVALEADGSRNGVYRDGALDWAKRQGLLPV